MFLLKPNSLPSISRTTGFEPDVVIYTDIPGFSRYLAGSDGNVYSKNYNNTRQIKKLTGKIDKDGYTGLLLRDDNGNRKYRRKHRIIATAFIPNPDNLPQVNHLDGNKQNCTPDNLEWSTQSDNIQHGYNSGLYNRKSPIIAHNITTGEDIEFDSIHNAGRILGINHQRIWECCNNRRNTFHGFTFTKKGDDTK